MRCGRVVAAFVLLLFLCFVSVSCSPRKDQPDVRIGVIKALGTISPYISERVGAFQKAGIKVELVEFPSGPALMEAFASSNLDMAYNGIAPAAIWRAKGIDLRVVASANSGGHVILVRKDSGLKEYPDLAGRKVATPTTGSVTDTLMRALFLKRVARLDPEKDLTLLPGMAPADMPTALLLTKEVDACVTWEPFAAQSLLQYENAEVLFSFKDYWYEQHGRNYPVNVVVAKSSFIREKPDLLKKVLDAHRSTQDFINNNPEEANKLIAKETGLDVRIIEKARESVEFTWQIDVQDSLAMLQYAFELGYIDQIPSPEQLFDLRFLN